MTGPSGKNSFCFPRISMFPSAAPRGNIEILGKQNEQFPSGPIIKCLMQKYIKNDRKGKKQIIKVFIKNSLRKQTCNNLHGNKKNKGKSILIQFY